MTDKQSYIPIETHLRFFGGRDAIHLRDLNINVNLANCKLSGVFNGLLSSMPQKNFIEYTLTFYAYLALNIIELDSWKFEGESCFDKIKNSDWVAELGGKVTPAYGHYRIQTYDWVIDIVCSHYELIIGDSKPI